MVCTFFGHRNAPQQIEPALKQVIADLITLCHVSLFYVGHQGNFDAMAIKLLSEFEKQYDIRYYVVLAYLPKRQEPGMQDDHMILPDGFEKFPPKFAVDHTNRWILAQSDMVVTYVRSPAGGAAHSKAMAIRQEKTVIELPI